MHIHIANIQLGAPTVTACILRGERGGASWYGERVVTRGAYFDFLGSYGFHSSLLEVSLTSLTPNKNLANKIK